MVASVCGSYTEAITWPSLPFRATGCWGGEGRVSAHFRPWELSHGLNRCLPSYLTSYLSQQWTIQLRREVWRQRITHCDSEWPTLTPYQARDTRTTRWARAEITGLKTWVFVRMTVQINRKTNMIERSTWANFCQCFRQYILQACTKTYKYKQEHFLLHLLIF